MMSRPFAEPKPERKTGSHRCACGSLISANKDACLKCRLQAELAAKGEHA